MVSCEDNHIKDSVKSGCLKCGAVVKLRRNNNTIYFRVPKLWVETYGYDVKIILRGDKLKILPANKANQGLEKRINKGYYLSLPPDWVMCLNVEEVLFTYDKDGGIILTKYQKIEGGDENDGE